MCASVERFVVERFVTARRAPMSSSPLFARTARPGPWLPRGGPAPRAPGGSSRGARVPSICIRPSKARSARDPRDPRPGVPPSAPRCDGGRGHGGSHARTACARPARAGTRGCVRRAANAPPAARKKKQGGEDTWGARVVGLLRPRGPSEMRRNGSRTNHPLFARAHATPRAHVRACSTRRASSSARCGSTTTTSGTPSPRRANAHLPSFPPRIERGDHHHHRRSGRRPQSSSARQPSASDRVCGDRPSRIE